MFYFYHQIKLQTIPYVQKQIVSFINYFENHLDLKGQLEDDQFVVRTWNQKTQKLTSILHKKYKQIQNFHYENWMDYRASLIFRSKMLLLEFFNKNQDKLYFHNSEVEPDDKQQNVNDFGQSRQEAVELDQYEKKEPQIKITQKSKQKTLKTKTEENAQESKQKSKLIKTPQQKKQEKKGNTLNISKDDVNKVLNKIASKGQNNQIEKKKKSKAVNNEHTPKELNTSKQLNKIPKDMTKSIQKSGQKIVSQNKPLKSVSKGKLQLSGVTKSKTTLTPSSCVNPHKNAKPMLADSKIIRQRKMTKQEYIEYLQSKNKIGQSS